MSINKKIIFLTLLIFFFLNILFLDYKILIGEKQAGEMERPMRTVVSEEKVTPPVKSDLNVCPEPCLRKINEATESLNLKPGEKTVEKVIEKQTQTVTAGNGPKEFFVPLGGSGSTTEGGWKDISGMEAFIDRTKYPGKITVLWEASLKVKDGNGEAHARLFNVTKNTAVDYSEITSIGPDYKRVTSNKINLASGNNLYKVQMFSTTQYEVFIQGGRIKITVE